MKILNVKSLFIPLLLGSSSFAQTCPPAPTSIDPMITAEVTFDKGSKTYIYNYKLTNGGKAQIPLEFLALELAEQPKGLTAGTKWSANYDAADEYVSGMLVYETRPQASDYKALAKSAHSTTNSALALRASAIRPGASLAGFSLRSPNPPGVVQFYAEGSTQPPKIISDGEREEPEHMISNCPGWGSDASRFASMVTGMVTGPLDPNLVSVPIRLRDEVGGGHCGHFHPQEKKGRISILVLNSKELDVRDITVSSLRFGPGEAVPISSKLVATGGESRADFDEHEHWERMAEALGRGQDKRLQHNLQVTFDLKDVDAKCVLDKALFLRGKTKHGQNLVGGVSSPFAGCDVQKPGVRRKRAGQGSGHP